MAADHPREEGCENLEEEIHGRLQRFFLQALPKGRGKTFLKRFEVLYGQMLHREKKLFPGSAWPHGEDKIFRLRGPFEGKTEGEENVWTSGKTVQEYF